MSFSTAVWVLCVVLAVPVQAADLLPRKPLDQKAKRSRMAALREYQTTGLSHRRPYHWTVNEYFCRRKSALARETRDFELDEQGLPIRRHKLGSWHHPIMLARNVINSSITFMNTGSQAHYLQAVTGANKLLELMGPDGAMRYRYPYPVYYYGTLPSGWTSAMAQGTVLSALARAYHITCDEKYLAAGDKALAHLLTPIEKGGTTTTLAALLPSLAGCAWYEEYPTPAKPGYTLNGFMYTLLGLWDWAETAHSKEARKAFDEGVSSLLLILPLFDHAGMSSYDLVSYVHDRRPVFNPHYHAVHLMQLSALYAITGEPLFEQYRERWYDAVGGPIEECGE